MELILLRNSKKEQGIKQLEDGTYFIRVTRRVNGERVERRGKTETKAEAKKLLAMFTLDLEDEKENYNNIKNAGQNNSLTFKMAHNLWFDSLDTDLAIGTKNTYDANYKYNK